LPSTAGNAKSGAAEPIGKVAGSSIAQADCQSISVKMTSDLIIALDGVLVKIKKNPFWPFPSI
jgi:hypothetical protein